MGGQAAEQIIAGVVLSERLAVTMYGAIHRAQWSGNRNLRGLVIDPKLLAEASFRISLMGSESIATVTSLEHPNIVPTVAVESGGPDVVVVTRGVGRYVTVQDLISAARASRTEGGKLSFAVSAAISKSVVEALASAHDAKIVHGAVHPRSVLVDEDGEVRLGDFVVGRALTTAVAQGADSSLWRGLSGYLAPELVTGEDPTPACDVFAIGSMLFTMLSGEAPPGALRATPAVERLVHRALDGDLGRRYKNAADLFENLLEAFEDDRWDVADRGEVIDAAGLSRTDTNIDDATEDLLASLGMTPGAVQRPSVDRRAETLAARHQQTSTAINRLDALLADLDDAKEHTTVDTTPFERDPISELIELEPSDEPDLVEDMTRTDRDLRFTREVPAGVKPRVPSLDDPDDETPLPPPHRDSELDLLDAARRPRPAASELAAMAAVAELEPAPPRPIVDPIQSYRGSGDPDASTPLAGAGSAYPESLEDSRRQVPLVASRARGIVALIVAVTLALGIVYLVIDNQRSAQDRKHELDELAARNRRAAEDETRRRIEALPDTGAISVRSTPDQAGVWLKLGRSPVDSLPLFSSQIHELRIEGLDGFEPVDTQVTARHWGRGTAAGVTGAKIVTTLKPIGKDPKTGRPAVVRLPAMPPEPANHDVGAAGRGSIRIETTPPGAEVWLYIGMTDAVKFEDLQAGRAYEFRVLKDGYRPGYVSVSVDEWREPGDDPNKPIDIARKRRVLDKSVELQPDPTAPKGR